MSATLIFKVYFEFKYIYYFLSFFFLTLASIKIFILSTSLSAQSSREVLVWNQNKYLKWTFYSDQVAIM